MVQTISAMAVNTTKFNRQKKLEELKDEQVLFELRKSNDRYLIHGNGMWLGELPASARSALARAEEEGHSVSLRGAKIVEVPAIVADLRARMFEVFDREERESLESKKSFGLAVQIEILPGPRLLNK